MRLRRQHRQPYLPFNDTSYNNALLCVSAKSYRRENSLPVVLQSGSRYGQAAKCVQRPTSTARCGMAIGPYVKHNRHHRVPKKGTSRSINDRGTHKPYHHIKPSNQSNQRIFFGCSNSYRGEELQTKTFSCLELQTPSPFQKNASIQYPNTKRLMIHESSKCLKNQQHTVDVLFQHKPNHPCPSIKQSKRFTTETAAARS